ncbi:MAG: hypothetical protein IT363_08750 [Methanoregulaceae archaeon]|nr:hypothetical protein [Methanoregulaceae archaeon]
MRKRQGGATSKVKPPKVQYSKVANETTWSSGEVKFRSISGFAWIAYYTFKGKNAVRPVELTLAFGTRRTVDSGERRSDSELAQWSGVSEIIMRWGDEPVRFPAKYERVADTDDFTRILIGRSFIERLFIRITADQFKELAKSSELLIRLGNHEDSLKGSALKPVKQLSDAIDAIGS